MPTFLDEANLHVQAGNGGDGAMHFHREKYVPLGGPDGGDGGNGANVLLKADRGLNTLYAFQRKRRFKAEDGQKGGATRMHGRMGKDLIVDVPVGTLVRDDASGQLLGDLTEHGVTLLVARGGKGGLGNVHFKTSTNQAPHFAEKGEPGESRTLALELKVIADIGIVGSPNAGKSTLLSVMSAARPKIADYPFTTLTPNLGVVEVGDGVMVAADIPGLVEGAHEGVGLGHEFLRHIERTIVLLHVVDAAQPEPLAAFQQVNDELGQYEASLLTKPQLVALNKSDLPEAAERMAELQDKLREQGYETVAVSAISREGLPELIRRIAQLQESERSAVQDQETADLPVLTPHSPEHFEVERHRKTFSVHGETVERLAVMTDMESDEAVYRLERRLKQMGVFTALGRAGVQEGSLVRIGEFEFHWGAQHEPRDKSGGRNRSRSRR